MANDTIHNNEWAFRPSSAVAFCALLRVHRFGYVDPASAHLLLPDDIQEQYLVDIARMAKEGTLRSVQTGHQLKPFPRRDGSNRRLTASTRTLPLTRRLPAMVWNVWTTSTTSKSR